MYYWWSFLSSLMWTVNKGDQKQLYQLSVEQWLKRYKNQLQWIYSSLKVCTFDCFHSRYIRMWCLYFSQNLLITVSQLQNHRRAEVGKVLWRSSGPSPLLSQSRIQSVPWTRHISNKGDLTTSLGSLCPSSDILTVKKKKNKKLFLDAQTEPPLFQIVPVESCHCVPCHKPSQQIYHLYSYLYNKKFP